MIHPGNKGPRSGKCVARLQHLEKNGLHQVLALFTLPQHLYEKAVERTVVPFKEQAHFVQVALFHLEHQCVICQCNRTQAVGGCVDC